MMQDDFEFAQSTKKLLDKVNRTLGEDSVRGLIIDYLLEDNSKQRAESREVLQSLVAANATELLFSQRPVMPAPSADLMAGEIRIGRLAQGENTFEDFSISPEDLQHAGIFAATYSGKTTLIATILSQLMRRANPIPWLAFDFKRDLRGLSRDYPVKVLRWNWLRLNPLQPPPGVQVLQWMTFMADMMAHVFGWFHASENYLMMFMQRAYDSKQGSYPTFRELHDLVAVNEETGRRFSEYREVVLNRLASMLIVLRDVMNTETGFPIERLLAENVVIELDGLRRDEANFLVELFLAYIFSYRLAKGERGQLAHLLVFDEASRFFFKGRQFRETTTELGISFIDTVPQIIRDYREGLLCAAQEPSLITHSLMSNLRTRFVGFLSEGEDLDAIATSLHLDEDEQQEMAKLGERGLWLVKKPGVRPFFVQTDDFPLPKDMSDAELQERMKGFISGLDSMTKQSLPPREEFVQTPKVLTPGISPDAWDLLVEVSKHPFRGIRARCRAMKISARRIERSISELVDKGLIATLSIPLGRFRPVRFMILTDGALNLLSNVGHDVSLWRKIGHVGFEHSLYQVLVAYALKKLGYDVSVEKKLQSGRRLDIHATRNGTRVGIEVELTTSGIADKVKVLDELDKLVILVKDEGKRADVLQEISEMPERSKTVVFKIAEFLARINSRISVGTSGTNFASPEVTEFQGSLEQSGGQG